ncbi:MULTISPECIES: EAL domain-containing protein [unclassified Salinivibrio]|uniref:bifunctional diguanylate cyclase/phosphodiesterase n=1 Tax=unclassified Salinivibrio TaxID=2636825 RepID=UPI00128B25B9|nr:MULTISPECIES: EAL domain-containing protein [unclassified Salinivibrio]MPS30851.1 EAL domain-containing protein [Salinivibrio sp. VYel7]MPX92252.1 EAL domain-containing protein [Salinivibrio sp. VYel9]MPX97172.1 EAL domain-containing protein [Salinivibrio sp. VYel6]MPX98484.1 EAL domain-containing protein [Salinivibrio sp. VYel4]MPY01815.1 EAL domain-containing protein [Salinivibrio sp. VYel5]
MTLFNQIFSWMLVIFFCIVLAVFGIELNTTRNFLLNQQTSDVNNTVNSMGLALAPYLESDDKVAAESVINAFFDGGFYREVNLTLLSDNSEIVREYPVQIQGVPQWFIDLDVFPVITEKQTITSGWMQLAEVEVVAHPGYAYKQLWKSFVQLGTILAIIFLVASVIIGWQLQRSLRPLARITAKAGEIAKNKFGDPIPLPPTTELKTVVNAINVMTDQLKHYFEQQAKEADRLRKTAYRDAVSGLGNRSFYVGQLKSWLTESGVGGMALIKVDLIGEAYKNQGFESGDRIVEQFANNLTTTIISDDSMTAARLSKDEFVILAPNSDPDDLRLLGESVLAMVVDMQADPTGLTPPKVAVGLAINGGGNQDASVLLSQADNALSQARNTPEHPVVLIDQSIGDAAMGKQQWKALLHEAVAKELFVFKYQPATDSESNRLHQEVFSAIEKDEHYYGAGHFLGAVEQLQLGETLDKYVITHVIKTLSQDASVGPLAVNLTLSSVTNASFIRWLGTTLYQHRKLAGQLLFEIPEVAFVRHADHTGLLTDQIRQAGFQFGVDNYGRNFQSLDYLQRFKPDYVKIDFAYTSHIEDDAQGHVLASICRTAHNLNITTIATRVETEAQLARLSELFVNGFQGYIFNNTQDSHG